MLELSQLRKSKINLADYNCKQDIENRILLSDFSTSDLKVLEELLFSPLKISLKKFVRNLDNTEEEVVATLKKLSTTTLVSIHEDTILIDKEMRKYFESQLTRFDEGFKPDMEFLQSILRKVPIHHLPNWYAIPRTSNNIFESIVEKYLLTPQIFQRYLMDLHFSDPTIHRIIEDLFSAPHFKLYSSDVIGKYNLTRHYFEEILLLLEFHFIGCLSYQKEDDHWTEIITPFYEWQQYLQFLQTTETPHLQEDLVSRTRNSDFAFIEDCSVLLKLCSKKPVGLDNWDWQTTLPDKVAHAIAPHLKINVSSSEGLFFAQTYIAQMLRKLSLIQFLHRTDKGPTVPESARIWLEKTNENKALFLYRNALNQILTCPLPAHIATERNIREAEKSIRRVFHGKWVLFDTFFHGITVTLSESSVLMLKRVGKQYKYVLPTYTEEEKLLVKATIFEWLFETGMVNIGTYKGQDCFAITAFGRFFFDG